jgi:hypothetical protein
MQNPAWPGREAVPLSDDKPTILRYRLVVHRGMPSREAIDGWLAEYAAQHGP